MSHHVVGIINENFFLRFLKIEMSVVRDILGVSTGQPSQLSPVAAVMSVMGAGNPKTSKKRKSFIREAREVANLRDSEGLVKSPPATPETEEKRWRIRKFFISGALSGEPRLLSHWDHRDDDRTYSATRCMVQVDMPEMTEPARSEIIRKYPSISVGEIESIFQLLKTTELNFIVTSDRSGHPTELVKDMYYTAYVHAFPHKKCKYSLSADVERKKLLIERQELMATQGADRVTEMRKRERELVAEIKETESELKSLESEFLSVEKIIDWFEPTPNGPKFAQLVSAEKKPPGYELINKYIPGIVELNAFLAGKPAELPQSTTQMVGKDRIDFSPFTKVNRACTSFNSKAVSDFFQQLAELNEMEKTLTAFIKKRDMDIKAAKKQL